MSIRPSDAPLYAYRDLVAFAAALYRAAGCDGDKPEISAELLVMADAMGHTTHGLAQLPGYLEDLASGAMLAKGEPRLVSDRGPSLVWDGERLPGVWLTAKAVDLAIRRARQFGQCAIAIGRSHHIACLATFLPAATSAGMMVMIASSDPSDAMVAPYGGRRAVFTPDPVAIGIPTAGDPILIDISASITTAGMTNRLAREGRKYPGLWALDAEGKPSDDPKAVLATPPGTLLPVGGLDHGHKGYGLALMVEALTQALAGHGRADGETRWGAGVFVQVYDPTAFAGLPAFIRQSEWLAEACRNNPPAPGREAVRLPGGSALPRWRDAKEKGLALYPAILPNLKPWAERYGLALPQPLTAA